MTPGLGLEVVDHLGDPRVLGRQPDGLEQGLGSGIRVLRGVLLAQAQQRVGLLAHELGQLGVAAAEIAELVERRFVHGEAALLEGSDRLEQTQTLAQRGQGLVLLAFARLRESDAAPCLDQLRVLFQRTLELLACGGVVLALQRLVPRVVGGLGDDLVSGIGT